MAIHFASQQLPVAVTLEGECNKCGLCCTAKRGEQWLFCHNLLVGAIGQPGGSSCLAYERRYDGMPIEMRSADGSVRVFAQCRKDSPEETAVIYLKGIGKGCSLHVKKD